MQRLIALGASQSAGRLGTYVNAIHPLTHAFDGYVLQIYFGSGSPLEVGDFVINLAAPSMSAGTNARLRGNNLLRDDVDVPVMVVNSELEAIACYEVRQPDTDLFRYWESAGTCHVSEQGQRARSPKYERDFGAPMQVTPGINRVPMVPLFDAAIHAMHGWVSTGKPPRSQPLVKFAGEPPAVVRDEHGIAKGGIRLPQVEVPSRRTARSRSPTTCTASSAGRACPSHLRRSPSSIETVASTSRSSPSRRGPRNQPECFSLVTSPRSGKRPSPRTTPRLRPADGLRSSKSASGGCVEARRKRSTVRRATPSLPRAPCSRRRAPRR